MGVSPDEIAARPSSERDLDDLVGDIQTLLRQKERTYNLPLVDIFHAIMAGERSDDQRRRFGDRTTRMGRKAIVSTIRSYAESTGNYALLNLLQKFEDPQPNMPTPARRQAVKVVRPVLSDKERDYASILSVIDRLGRPAGSADLGRFRRRWLEYPPRDPTSSHRNRLEEVLAAMTRDGVLRATRTAAGAFVYTPGQNADQYRGAGGAAPAMSSNAL